MAIPFPKFQENSLNLKRFTKNPNKNQDLKKLKKPSSNLRSIWAILSSIFMYISVFYIFNLSPSTLICTTKFWFFISNTLVLIISADFAAFSSTKKLDSYEDHTIKDTIATSSESNTVVVIYDEYQIKDTTATSLENKSIVSTHEKHVTSDIATISSKNNIIVPTYEEHWIKDTTATLSSKSNVHVSTYKEHMIEEATETSSESNTVVSTQEEHVTKYTDATSPKCDIAVSNEMVTWCDVREEEENPQWKNISSVEKKQEKCVRSNSANAAVVAAAEEEERAVVLQRTSSERHEERLEEEEKSDEFSRMSNEELNTRVEEFIRRFNRQIRLQAVRNRHNFQYN